MIRRRIFLIYVVLVFCFITSSNGEIDSRFSYGKTIQNVLTDIYKNFYSIDQPRVNSRETVDIKLYYECNCLGCRDFDTTDFKEVLQKLNKYLTIHTYPYGNAKTIYHNGTYEFKCQHGPEECYGNKLHACALDILLNQTEALLYNTCMMEFTQDDNGSDDNAADKCATSMNIDSKPIKACAKGEKGTKLLKYYGDESKKANFRYVPYVLLNGKEYRGDNFMKDVCAAYAKPPPPCAQFE